MSGCGREALPNVREALPKFREWSRDHPGYPGVVGGPSWMSESVRGLSRMSGSFQETLPDIRECSGDPLGFAGVVGSPSRMFGSGREALPNV